MSRGQESSGLTGRLGGEKHIRGPGSEAIRHLALWGLVPSEVVTHCCETSAHLELLFAALVNGETEGKSMKTGHFVPSTRKGTEQGTQGPSLLSVIKENSITHRDHHFSLL